MTRISPTLRQRRLGMVLRRLRDEDGRTAQQVAADLGWSRQKVVRLEDSPRKPVLGEIIKLLDAYGVGDPRREEILELVSQARERGWWDTYRTQISRDYDAYIGLEAEAINLRTWEATNIPGLLQTADYTRALIRTRRPGLSDEELEARVAVRTGRQDYLLSGPDPVHLWAIVGEGAMRQTVGGPTVLREQLEHLLKMAELPNVRLQVLPFCAGAAPAQGPFVVMSFAERTDPEVVYLETPAGAMWIEDGEQVAAFLADHVRLIQAALPVDRTRALIATLAEELPR